jgi:hypothetical protein
MILKYGSANIMFLGSTALVPLTNALFAMQWIPGHQDLKPTDLLGLGVIMGGIVVYRFMKRVPGQKALATACGVQACVDEDSDDDDSDGDDVATVRRKAHETAADAAAKGTPQSAAKAQHAASRLKYKKASAARAGKSALYVGLNAIPETIQPLLQTRQKMAKAARYQLPQRSGDTRSPYLSRLGISPSPKFGARSPAGRSPAGMAPGRK